MNEPTSPDEFDQFLAQSQKEEARRQELEAVSAEMEGRVQAALAAVNYRPLDDDDGYYASELEEYASIIMNEMTFDDDTPYNLDEATQLAKKTLYTRGANERYLITILRINLLKAMATPQSLDESTARKRKLFAELWVEGRISLNRPFFHVFNDLLPGETIDIDSTDMVPYLVTEMAKSAVKEEDNREFMQSIEDALEFAGINLLQHFDKLSRYYFAATNIKLAGFMRLVNRFKAEEATLRVAREQDIEPEIAQKIAEFFLTHPPLPEQDG